MTSINPVQSFREMPKAKKAATVASAAVATAAVASVALAWSKGKTEDIKGLKAIANGYKLIGEKAKGKFESAKAVVGKIFKKDPKAAQAAAEAPKATEAVQEVAQSVSEVVEEVAQ